jgi:hypothetical protein
MCKLCIHGLNDSDPERGPGEVGVGVGSGGGWGGEVSEDYIEHTAHSDLYDQVRACHACRLAHESLRAS